MSSVYLQFFLIALGILLHPHQFHLRRYLVQLLRSRCHHLHYLIPPPLQLLGLMSGKIIKVRLIGMELDWQVRTGWLAWSVWWEWGKIDWQWGKIDWQWGQIDRGMGVRLICMGQIDRRGVRFTSVGSDLQAWGQIDWHGVRLIGMGSDEFEFN